MKKLIVIPFIMIFLISCAGIQLNDTQSILGEIAARRLAYSLAKSNPEIIDPGIAICDGILKSSGESTSTLFNGAMYLLIDKIDTGNDPMLRADLSTLLSALKISGFSGVLPDSTILKAATSAFRVGLEAAQERR